MRLKIKITQRQSAKKIKLKSQKVLEMDLRNQRKLGRKVGQEARSTPKSGVAVEVGAILAVQVPLVTLVDHLTVDRGLTARTPTREGDRARALTLPILQEADQDLVHPHTARADAEEDRPVEDIEEGLIHTPTLIHEVDEGTFRVGASKEEKRNEESGTRIEE